MNSWAYQNGTAKCVESLISVLVLRQDNDPKHTAEDAELDQSEILRVENLRKELKPPVHWAKVPVDQPPGEFKPNSQIGLVIAIKLFVSGHCVFRLLNVQPLRSDYSRYGAAYSPGPGPG